MLRSFRMTKKNLFFLSIETNEWRWRNSPSFSLCLLLRYLDLNLSEKHSLEQRLEGLFTRHWISFENKLLPLWRRLLSSFEKAWLIFYPFLSVLVLIIIIIVVIFILCIFFPPITSVEFSLQQQNTLCKTCAASPYLQKSHGSYLAYIIKSLMLLWQRVWFTLHPVSCIS